MLPTPRIAHKALQQITPSQALAHQAITEADNGLLGDTACWSPAEAFKVAEVLQVKCLPQSTLESQLQTWMMPMCSPQPN